MPLPRRESVHQLISKGMSMRSSLLAAGAGLSVLLAACSTPAELGHPATPAMPAAFHQAEAASAAWDGPWWTSFDDPQQAQRHHERRRDEGLEAVSIADDARAETARIEAYLVPVRTTIVAAQQHLATLLGSRDMSLLQPGATPSAWGKVPRIAAGQPSELLWRRPDLLAAESRLRAEGERVESARAQRWPKLFLSALLGHGNLALNGIMNGPARFSN